MNSAGQSRIRGRIIVIWTDQSRLRRRAIQIWTDQSRVRWRDIVIWTGQSHVSGRAGDVRENKGFCEWSFNWSALMSDGRLTRQCLRGLSHQYATDSMRQTAKGCAGALKPLVNFTINVCLPLGRGAPATGPEGHHRYDRLKEGDKSTRGNYGGFFSRSLPQGGPRKAIPAEKDVVKRLLLFLLSIVALQVYLTPVAHLDERLPAPERQELGLKCESFLHPWPLWMGYSTTSALCNSPQRVQVNITCPTVHPSHRCT
ncbi:uncharacterized protein LOC129715284 [Leucoraja erinacea]|uniref:uncharacterized protein LOC129715284 n=1 Tax=Leucoraja erinaceus TaxID=7782 RepID=UPI0024560D39|nr:uncharacterized protein LOC129715284 [Leucoraja erinacea]